MTKPKKSPRQLAEEHWTWIELILETQRIMEKRLFIDAFIHGMKHGKKEEKNGRVRTRISKKQ